MSIILAPISHIDPIGTSPLALDVIGNYAFYLDGPRDNSGDPPAYTLTAIQINAPSISAPTAPVIASFADTGDATLNGFIGYAIDQDSSLYYVLDSGNGGTCYVFDISDPTSLALSDTLTNNPDFTDPSFSFPEQGAGLTPTSVAAGPSGPVFSGSGVDSDMATAYNAHDGFCSGGGNPTFGEDLLNEAAVVTPGGTPTDTMNVSLDDYHLYAPVSPHCDLNPVAGESELYQGAIADTVFFAYMTSVPPGSDPTATPADSAGLLVLDSSAFTRIALVPLGLSPSEAPFSIIALDVGGDGYGFVQSPEGTQTIYSNAGIETGSFDDNGQIRIFGGNTMYVGGIYRQQGLTFLEETGNNDVNVYDVSDLTAPTQTDGPLFANTYPDGRYSNIQCFDVGTLLLYTIDQGPGDADVPQFEFSIWSLDGSITPPSGGGSPSGTGSISIYDVTATPPALIQQIVGPSSSVAVQGREFYAGPAGGPNIFQYKWGGFYCSSVSTDELLVDGAAQIDILKAREGYFRGNLVCENLLAGSIMQVVAFEDPTADDIPTGAFVCWQNVNAGTVKIYANVFGSLVSVTLS
jgi:hypothetical protein